MIAVGQDVTQTDPTAPVDLGVRRNDRRRRRPARLIVTADSCRQASPMVTSAYEIAAPNGLTPSPKL
jgi:hypothetical protein